MKRLTIFFVLMAIGIAGAGAIAAPVLAKSANNTEGACKGSFWGFLTQDICVYAVLGGMNHANGTEWVGSVQAAQPDGVNSFAEIWGDGFYFATHGVSPSWTINKWVRSGTNICAAETDPYGVREIACIKITVSIENNQPKGALQIPAPLNNLPTIGNNAGPPPQQIKAQNDALVVPQRGSPSNTTTSTAPLQNTMPRPTNSGTTPPIIVQPPNTSSTTTTQAPPPAPKTLTVDATTYFGNCTATNTPSFCGPDARSQTNAAYVFGGGTNHAVGTRVQATCWKNGGNVNAPATNTNSTVWIKTTMSSDPWMSVLYFAPGAADGLSQCS